MKNTLSFKTFLSTLRATNRNLGFFVDWQKCLANKDKLSIALNHLNLLLGVPKDSLQDKITLLFNEYAKAFDVLPLILAIRNERELVLDSKSNETPIDTYLQNPKGIYDFICESGLDSIFSDRKIKDLNDFVFGVEVGLDSNARKNRGGAFMESYLRTLFIKANLNFKEQVNIVEFSDLQGSFGDDKKRFDFVIFGKTISYFIECNFYTSGGSKLNETARAYQELAPKFDRFANKNFVWITDGQGWHSSKNKLQEAYKSVEMYNLSNIKDFIKKAQNDC
ncbi:type II restriction endonuclease [Helicobacter labetoulli]|uniref:type II restriction endonuclease n=1 Tax=Helicobacter labetoulli TaxID=2315333 RepID=UPI000EF65B14|nr:type II restriction endonuclease [Helicobacter labetoulli]